MDYSNSATMALLLLLLMVSATVSGGTQISIDGAWSPWSNIETPCMSTDMSEQGLTVQCGGGLRKRYRSCTNPTKQGSGIDCVGDSEQLFPCNEHPCQLPGDFLWSPWGACSVTCGRGVSKRYTMCGTVRERTSSGVEIRSTVVDGVEYELEYESACVSNQVAEGQQPCNTWSLELCPSPCLKQKCPLFSKCRDISNETDPGYQCECQVGTVMQSDASKCVVPPPAAPTPRPYPTLPPKQKIAANIMTRGASTLIVIFLSVSLGLFILLGIFDPARVIHMNMELSLLLAHICLLPQMHGHETQEICRVISILTNFFYVACFIFMFLESVYMYSMVAWVVHKDGLLTRGQNVLVGWGSAFVIILLDLCFEYDNFGGEYHCFLRLDTNLMYGIYVPVIVLVIVTFAIVEAAGGTAEYDRLAETDPGQRTTAKIMQRTLLLILPLVFASYVLGSLAEFEQNLYLYSTFTLVNGVLGAVVFFFHCSANKRVRDILTRVGKIFCPGKEKSGA